MTTNNDFYEIQKLIYQKKDFDNAIDLLLKSNHIVSLDFQSLLAHAYFLKLDIEKAEIVFQNLDDDYAIGFCKLLQNNVSSALSYFAQAKDTPAKSWSMFFCELFGKDITLSPTYLQIRAFLERDLNLFLKLNLVEFVQKIMDISEFLFEINPETDKIIARTFLYNDYPQYAKEFLERGLDFTDKDSDLFYLFGLYFIKINNSKEAKNSFTKALQLNPNHIPAKQLLDKLEKL